MAKFIQLVLDGRVDTKSIAGLFIQKDKATLRTKETMKAILHHLLPSMQPALLLTSCIETANFLPGLPTFTFIL